jgi:hypothetical protein
MPGWITNGVPNNTIYTGAELWDMDTQNANGSNPQTATTNTVQLAAAISYFGQVKDKTMVSGSRYYSSINIGFPATLTGIQALVGTTGGTDSWIFELHGPTGLLLATTATAGTTAGTASTWQRIAFTATYSLTVPGTYYIAVQSNGTTAKLATLNSDVNPTLTGSATGVFGTGASITVPTTYTANLGPMAMVY